MSSDLSDQFEVVEAANHSLMLVDDEPDILKSLTRVLRHEYDVVSFTSGSEALDYLKDNEVSVIISDMRMPEMDGAELLSRARELCPDSVRYLLSGYSDFNSTVRAINEGGIHSYIAKPWDNEALKLTIAKGVELYNLKKDKQRLTKQLEEKNRELLELNQSLEDTVLTRTFELRKSNRKLQLLVKNRSQTFNDILATLKAIIQFSTGSSGSHTERIAALSKAVALKMGLEESEVTEIYLCSLIHEIGLLNAGPQLSPTIVGDAFSSTITYTPLANGELGAEIISQIKRFEPLVPIIRSQDENYNGTGVPDHLAEDEIPVGARILRIVKNYDYLVSDLSNETRMTPSSARAFIKDHSGSLYDKEIAKVFLDLIEKEAEELDTDMCIGLDELRVGAIVKQDIYLPNGVCMVTAGQEVNAHMLKKLKAIEEELDLPIAIFI
ncbi:response regulator [Vibrio sp. JC009]|uniref:HD domain-containing phosphohydrolase n=1 Tax=Vibrio sp. JC009 TaxID=2912314 RepID=UPI0023B1F6F4|nr:HD domain-containing phosphohydrolase [Vibrio sp. JC009]WED20775.1 response regulator [Vibrio sp. JC009]